MKTLILFSTRDGQTREIASYLASELKELGIQAEAGQLREVGMRRCGFESTFYGQPFKDNELSRIYLYQEPVEIGDMVLQEDEVSEVIWMDYAECREKILADSFENCIYIEEFDMIGEALGIAEKGNGDI